MRFLCFNLCLVLASYAAAADRPPPINGIAAIANSAIITRQEVDVLAAPAIESLARAYRGRQAEFERKAIEAWTDALEHLIERQLILDDFKDSGLVFPEKYIDEQINDIIRNRYGDRVKLGQTLQAEGMTFAGFRERQRDNLIIDVMQRRNVRENVIISPAKIEHYYQTNFAAYKLDDQIKLRSIVLDCSLAGPPDDTRQLALEIHRKIGDGADFAEMATINSIPPSRNGGALGWLQRSKMSKSFADIADPLDAGKCSGVFSETRESDQTYWIYFYDPTGRLTKGLKYSSAAGKEAMLEEKAFTNQTTHADLPAQPQKFYILKVEEKKIAHTRPLEEVREDIEKELLLQERGRLRKQWIDRLKAKSFVRRY